MTSIAVLSGQRARRRRTAPSRPDDQAQVDTAFAVLYRTHASAVYRYFARRLGTQAAEDLTADTFAAALGGLARFDPARGSEVAWLFGIAAHVLAGHRRAQVRHLRLLSAHGVDALDFGHEDEVVERVTAGSHHRAVAAAVADLPDFDREALLLTAWDELTYVQAAEVLGSTADHVRSRLHRARTALRRRVALSQETPS